MKKADLLSLYPDNMKDFEKLKHEKLASKDWIVPYPKLPHVYFDPKAHIYYRYNVFEDIQEDKVDEYKKGFDNEGLVYRYAPFLNFVVPEKYSGIFHVEPNDKKNDFKQDVYRIHRIAITHEMPGVRLLDFFRDNRVSTKKHDAVAHEADYEVMRGKITLGDADRHDGNMFVLNPQKRRAFKYGHIDFIRAQMNEETHPGSFYYGVIESLCHERHFQYKKIRQICAEQIALVERHHNHFEQAHHKIISHRLNNVCQYIDQQYSL